MKIKLKELDGLHVDDGLIIVRLFLEKVELLREEERNEILKTIQLLNNPIFITKS